MRSSCAERGTVSEFVSVIVTRPALTVAGNVIAFCLALRRGRDREVAGLAAAASSSSSPQPATSAAKAATAHAVRRQRVLRR